MLLIDTRKGRVGVLTTGPVAVAGPTFTGWPVSVRSHSTVCTLRPLAHDVRLDGRLGRLRGARFRWSCSIPNGDHDTADGTIGDTRIAASL